jgi:hypothetical protein
MPRIEMTPTVRFALFFLRVYLIVLLALITLKFVRTFSGASPLPQSPPPAERIERAEDAGPRTSQKTSGVFTTSKVSAIGPYSAGSERRSDSSSSRVPWRSHQEAT